jgi:hypothetical protein
MVDALATHHAAAILLEMAGNSASRARKVMV